MMQTAPVAAAVVELTQMSTMDLLTDDEWKDHMEVFIKKKKIPWKIFHGIFGILVGARGFEPPASASRTQRSSQTEPRPVCS